MRYRPIMAVIFLAGALSAGRLPNSTATGPAPASSPSRDQSAAARALQALMDDEWTYQLEHSPVFASLSGDRRWNDRWDDRSLSAIEEDNRHNLAMLKSLGRIDRLRLAEEDQLNYDLFRRDHQEWVDAYAFKWHLLPTDHLGYLPEVIRERPSVQTAYQLGERLRFDFVRDYEDWIVRLHGFPRFVDQITALMREGVRAGMVHPRVILERIPAQVRRQIMDDPTQSGFYAPFRHLPATVPAGEGQRLAAAGREAISREVVPALKRFLDFLESEYIPAAPDRAGIWQMPNGGDLYAFWVRVSTTPGLTPEQAHATGLAEITRIRGEMEKVMRQTGFQGSLTEFFAFLRTAPRFYYATPEELLLHYRNLAKMIDPKLVKLFRTLPRMPYGVEPMPEVMAPDTSTGFYYPAAADGSRPGTFLVNLYRPETRPRWEMVPLALHEAVPGHHLQVSLAAEQTGFPAFRRNAYHMAFSEGWALYCETLGGELGLYDDPTDRFGQLVFEMWRAERLVVDTGIHFKRWTRQQAIDFMLGNSPRQELDVTNEVDRYIVSPGQALAYKIGQMKIRELRTRAERELGPDFDVRRFHDAVLLGGSLPLEVLERRIDAWIASQKGSAAFGK